MLDAAGARAAAAERPSLITLPAEDVSYQVVERFFPRCPVRYDTVFLRWDKTRSVAAAAAASRARGRRAPTNWPALAEAEAARSVDWWRQVGAALRFPDGHVASRRNEHHPHRLSPYAAGDPRRNFFKGVHLEISTADARRGAADRRRGRARAARPRAPSCTSPTSRARRARS